MSFLNKLKSKAQQALGDHSQPQNDNPSLQASEQSSQGAFAHNGQTLNFQAPHLQSLKPAIPQPGISPRGPGQLPPKVANHTYLPPMRFLNPSGHAHPVMRDLGFTGVLDNRIIWTWGDTLMGSGNSAAICAVDSTSIGHPEAKGVVLDSAIAPNSNNVANWIDCNAEEQADGGLSKYAFGGTNIVEYPLGSGHGVVYYLKNSRPGGVQKIKGAGIATVTIDSSNIPHSQRCGEILWNELEPWYGDVGAVYNAEDSHIYVFGHGPDWDQELSSRTFLARCPAAQATDINSYEYWRNGAREWTKQRQANGTFGTAKLEKEDAIFDWHVMNQAVPFWSAHYNCWMFVHGSGWPASDVLCRTAAKLEGPWSDHGSLCSTAPNGDEQGYRYCINAHPEYDASGKTVYVTWTRENVIYGVDIVWE